MKGLAKAKIIGTNEWVEGYFIKQYSTATIYIPDEHLKNHNFDYYHVDENTYCKDTGIPDKNGNRIFENDILKTKFISEKIIIVKWNKEKLQYLFEEYDSNGVLFDVYERDELGSLEIIGNIFDNQESLEIIKKDSSIDENTTNLMMLDDFAKKLNGRNYRDYPQIPKNLSYSASKNGIVIVYGASDDLIEFEGAINDETGCFNGGKVFFDKNGVNKNGSNMIEAVWCDKNRTDEDGNVITWTYKTDIPHETFMIYDGDEPYCEGIVFKLSDLKQV